MKNDPLVSIVGDPLRAKMLRLFVMHQINQFTVTEIASALRILPVKISKMLRTLVKEGIIKQKVISIRISKKVKGKEKKIVKKEKGIVITNPVSFIMLLKL